MPGIFFRDRQFMMMFLRTSNHKNGGTIGVFILYKRLEYQCHNDYPKETNEHHALADARWNMALHKFLEHL